MPFRRWCCVVTNLPMEPEWDICFYNQRGTAEQHIKEGKYAINWTRLSCKRFRDNEVRLELHALAYNLGSFFKRAKLPEEVADWSMTSIQSRLIKIGARVVRHARKITFQLAEVVVSGGLFGQIITAIRNIKPPPKGFVNLVSPLCPKRKHGRETMVHQFRNSELSDGALACLADSSPQEWQHTKFGAVLEAIQEHMVYSETDARGRIMRVNPAFCALSGYAEHELVGSFHSIVNSGTHTRDFWRNFWLTLRSENAWHGEICNRAKDGSFYWVDSVILPVRGDTGEIERYVAILHDITDEKRAENALRCMGRMVEHSTNEVFVFDAENLQFTLVNRGARDNLGYSSVELSRLTPVDIKPAYDEPTFRRMIAPLIDGTRDMLSFQTIHQRSDGSHYPTDIDLHYAPGESPPVFLAFVQDITQRRETEEKMRRLALFDALTGLANREQLQQHLEDMFQEPDGPLYLFCLDLNRFKQINDTFGHATGDTVLKVVAERLGAAMNDARLIARLGGDEFVVLHDAIDPDHVRACVDRLLANLTRPILVNGTHHTVGASIGIACHPEDCSSPEELLQAADIAMYYAKTRDIDFAVYDVSMKKRVEARQQMSERLAHAMKEGALSLAFQPFIDLKTRELTGVEALLRWTDPDLGYIPPLEIISVAQENRMMRALGRWVVQAACKTIMTWQDEGHTLPCPISINVAAEQLENGSILEDLVAACASHSVRPNQFEVELTESSMMTSPEEARQVVTRLQALGVKVAIDDFGTGYSSIARLMQVPVDKLKIDTSFINVLTDDSPMAKIVEATMALAKAFDCSVVAEGIETEMQADVLRRLGCTAGQGFLLGQPLPAKAFSTRWL